MNDNQLGKRIKQARKKVGLTQMKLAKKIGVAYPTLNKYENGHRTPDSMLLANMADILDCDSGWLLSGKSAFNGDVELSEIVNILQNDLPEAKEFVLMVLKGKKQVKEGLIGIQGIIEKKVVSTLQCS